MHQVESEQNKNKNDCHLSSYKFDFNESSFLNPFGIHSKNVNKGCVKGGTTQTWRRVSYLWRTAHLVLKTDLQLTHHLTSELVKLALSAGCDLPDFITESLCPRCNMLQVPGLTCKVRVNPRSRTSRVNKRRRRRRLSQTLASEVVQTCNVCDTQHKLPGRFSRGTKRKDSRSAQQSHEDKTNSVIDDFLNSKAAESQHNFEIALEREGKTNERLTSKPTACSQNVQEVFLPKSCCDSGILCESTDPDTVLQSKAIDFGCKTTNQTIQTKCAEDKHELQSANLSPIIKIQSDIKMSGTRKKDENELTTSMETGTPEEAQKQPTFEACKPVMATLDLKKRKKKKKKIHNEQSDLTLFLSTL